MRVSTSFQFETYSSQIQAAQQRYFEAQQRVVTGKRFSVASEDPDAAHTVLSVNALKARTAQLDANLRTAKDYLGNTDSAFSEVSTALNRVYTLVVNGANSAQSQASLESMANEVADIQKRIVYLANTQGSNGQFVFAGQASDKKPFTETPPTLTFNGDDNPVDVEVRPGETMRVNLQGAGTLFTSLYAQLETVKNDLLSGNQSQLSGQDIPTVQGLIRQANAVRADAGSQFQMVDNLSTQNQRRIDDLARTASDAQDIDLSAAITDMQSAETAYAAALQVTARGQNLSLMDFLR